MHQGIIQRQARPELRQDRSRNTEATPSRQSRHRPSPPSHRQTRHGLTPTLGGRHAHRPRHRPEAGTPRTPARQDPEHRRHPLHGSHATDPHHQAIGRRATDSRQYRYADTPMHQGIIQRQARPELRQDRSRNTEATPSRQSRHRPSPPSHRQTRHGLTPTLGGRHAHSTRHQ